MRGAVKSLTAAIAAAVLAEAGSARADDQASPRREAERDPDFSPYFSPRSRYALKGSGGKKLAMGAYKGSQAAKRATRRGGNPARSGLPR